MENNLKNVNMTLVFLCIKIKSAHVHFDFDYTLNNERFTIIHRLRVISKLVNYE